MKPARKRSSIRIAFDIERDRNRRLLSDLLADYEVVEFSDAVPEGTDLCVIDDTALNRSAERFRTWHDDQSPVFAPVVLLAETDRRDLWIEYAEAMKEYVDSVFQIPMQRAEVGARIENLLQMREFSRQLDEERQLTDLVFESSPLAKLVLTPDGTVVRANKRFAEVFDVEPSALIGASYYSQGWTAVHHDGTEIPEAELPFSRLLETGKSVYDYEYILERPDHESMWVSVNMAPIRDQSHDIAYVVSVIEDITVRHTQAKKLEQQVELFDKAQRIADVGAWEYDVLRDELYWTEQTYSIHGLSPDETLSVDQAIQRYHPASRQTIQTNFLAAVEDGKPYDLELQLVRADGDERWVHTHGEPTFEDGAVIFVRGTIQDITERKERELELQQMKNAVDKAPIGIVLTDPAQANNPIVYVNDGFIELTGYTPEQALGRNCRFLQGEGTDPETIDRLRTKMAANESATVTIQNYRADGTPFWNRLEIAPVHSADGSLVNYIGFQQDVTDLVDRQRQLEILDRYLRHNIRNKMNVVNGLAALIQEESQGLVREYAENIEDASSTLLGNLDKERGVMNLLQAKSEPTTVDVMAVCRSVVDNFSRWYPSATVSISGPETATVLAVPELSTGLAELVRNAIVHNDNDAPTVEMTVEPGTETTHIHIADDGPGIPSMEIEVLTDPDAETPLKHGQGLGLWLVYLIVNRSGGSLSFTERETGGSDVTIQLPQPEQST